MRLAPSYIILAWLLISGACTQTRDISTPTPTATSRSVASPSPTATSILLPIEGSDPETNTIEWLQEHAVPFSDVDLNGEFEDFSFLIEMVGDARIVALGEATHGTSEFFILKSQFFSLVEDMNFRSLAVEMPMVEVDLIDQMIQNGVGEPGSLARGLANVEEALDLFEWMQTYNQEHGDKKINLLGIDFTGSVSLKISNVINYIMEVDPSKVSWFEEQMACLDEHIEDKLANFYHSPEDEKGVCLETMQLTYDSLLGK
jgi:erythromycin esterase-like protein